MMSIIERAKFLRKEAHKTSQQRAEERRVREQALAARLKRGLSGHKLGKHKVAEGNVDVQLGEDLSESLRALKVCSWIIAIPTQVSCPIRWRVTCSATGSSAFNSAAAWNLER